MDKRVLFFFILLSFTSVVSAQSTARIIDWKLLAEVEFEDKYYPEYEAWYLTPVFSENLKKLDGKKVIIKGYIIPMDVEGKTYALSAYPFSACFFCGGAGPETVMSLHFAKVPDRYETDEVLFLSGTLKLNDDQLDQFTYILQGVKEVEK